MFIYFGVTIRSYHEAYYRFYLCPRYHADDIPLVQSRWQQLLATCMLNVRHSDDASSRSYNADDLWCGLAGSNYSQPLSNIGSEEDWHTFIDAAHARNITVTSFWNAAYFWTGSLRPSPVLEGMACTRMRKQNTQLPKELFEMKTCVQWYEYTQWHW